MTPSKQDRAHRRSLRQSLRNLLSCRRRRCAIDRPRTLGSGILRKADPTTPSLPRISQVSLFPDFESDQFNLDQLSTRSLPADRQSRQCCTTINFTSTPHQRLRDFTTALLPSTRLSEFDLHRRYLQGGPLRRQVQLNVVQENVQPGISRAALVSEDGIIPPPRHKPSTLKIQRSSNSLSQRSAIPERTSTRPSPGLRRQQSSRDLEGEKQSPVPNSNHDAGSTTVKPWLQPQDEGRDPSIRHFGSFCVLDTAVSGYPVTATSEDLKHIFDVGEQFFLHNEECAESSLDIVTGLDAVGNEVTHLVLFSPLVSPSSGRSRFMLAAMVDITTFLLDTASLPGLETISEESIQDEELCTPNTNRKYHGNQIWRAMKHELSVESLLGGCFVDEEREVVAKSTACIPPLTLDDVWLHLAWEERRSLSSPVSSRSGWDTTPSLLSTSTRSSTSSIVDDVLEDFMRSLQRLYSDFFLLAKSPLDERFYEICNVSPSVHASKDYVDGHLSRTRAEDIEALSEQLSGESPFTMQAKWGRNGQDKQLYCVPLFGQSSITWICILVDTDIGRLW